ncbi:MAG TPA: PHP domain-containing protein [Dehalococcoidia bacterium]|jgi:predicted metal-dependent phosphoesterase TrpH|nr:PHP domain-containing protein [Dehalococcoidia bacterium]
MGALVDLHLHTTVSDGRLTPSELITFVASKGLKIVSVSDHDTTDGLAEAYQAAQQYPDLRIIPGIELSTDIPGDEIHMLGYFIQYDDEAFQSILRRFRAGRLERGRLMVEKLAQHGVHIQWERVQEIAGEGSVGRPHIALAMVEKGYFKEPKDAFAEYLGRNGLAYVERQKMTPEEGVQMLAQVGGVPVLAHPAQLADLDSKVAHLKAMGLMGMEVHYAMYPPETIQRLADVARRHGLIPCGGSDYHGLGNTGEPLPGVMGPPLETVERLEEAAQKLSRAAN